MSARDAAERAVCGPVLLGEVLRHRCTTCGAGPDAECNEDWAATEPHSARRTAVLLRRIEAAIHAEGAAAEARVARLRAALDAIARAHDPRGTCTAACASQIRADCDCGYVEAAGDVVGFARQALAEPKETPW